MARRVRWVILGAAVMTVSLACSGAGTAGGPNGGADGTAFTAVVDAEEVPSVTGNGYFTCEDVNGGEFNVSASLSFSNNVLLSFPDEATAGFHLLESEAISPDPAAYTATYYDSDGNAFEFNVTGSVVLTAVPSAPGERIAGEFDFSAEDSDDDSAQVVAVSGEFDFLTPTTWTCG